jgi:hydrogenase maturation protease
VTQHPVAVIGIGNAYRSDDAVGLYVAGQIRSQGLKGVTVVEGIGDGYALIDAWSDSDWAFVIDCASSGAPPGTIFRFDALRETIPSDLFSGLSTHSIAVNDAIELARVLDRLPRGLVVFGIEAENLTANDELSSVVQDNAHKVVKCIVEEIQALTNS